MSRIIFSFLLLAMVGSLDYITGNEVKLGSLYLLTVAIASWNLRLGVLIFYALTTVAVWSIIEWIMGIHFAKTWMIYWNVFNRCGVVAITGGMVSKAKATVDQQQRLIRALGQTLLKANRFRELVPVCRLCHEIHLNADYQAKLAEVLREGDDADSIGEVCHACREKLENRVASIPVDKYFQADAS